MPTIFTHALVPAAIGLGLGKNIVSRRLLAAGALAAIAPDFDVAAFHFHIPYADVFGHRGASHSLVMALLLGLLALACARPLHTTRLAAFVFVAASAFSHGLLDTLTNGGYGVALWWPFSGDRIFSPWQVIEVSPLRLQRFFSERGLTVLISEFRWVWIPAIAGCLLLVGGRGLWTSRRERLVGHPQDDSKR